MAYFRNPGTERQRASDKDTDSAVGRRDSGSPRLKSIRQFFRHEGYPDVREAALWKRDTTQSPSGLHDKGRRRQADRPCGYDAKEVSRQARGLPQVLADSLAVGLLVAFHGFSQRVLLAA